MGVNTFKEAEVKTDVPEPASMAEIPPPAENIDDLGAPKPLPPAEGQAIATAT